MTTGFVSKTFINKNGEEFRTFEHVASFNGKHNASKSKCLMVLYYRKFTLRQFTGLRTGELHAQSGVSYKYLKSRLALWVKWGLIKANAITYHNQLMRSYSLDEGGRNFVNNRIPKDKLQEYASEIRQYTGKRF